MRRILIVPSVSSSSVVNSDSFNEFYSLTETILGLNEKAYWYVVVPSWVRDGLRAHDHINYVYMETTRDPLVNDIVGYSAFDVASWFARRGGRHVVDLVITDCVQFAWQLGQLISDPVRDRVPVIVRDLRQSHLNKWKTRESEISVAVSLAVNQFGYMSDQHRDSVVEFLNQYIKPSLIDGFLDNAFRWPVSSDLEQLDKCKGRVAKREKITAFYGGDPSWNNGRKVLSIYRKLFAFGIDTVVASTFYSSKVKRVFPDRDVSYMADINLGLSTNSYYLEAARAHLFVSASDNDVALYDEIERLVLGQVGIFAFGEAENILGKDYPFYYNINKDNEACELALWISENYTEAQKMVGDYLSNIRDKMSKSIICGSVWRNICKYIDEPYKINKMKKEIKGKRQPLVNSVLRVAQGLGDEFVMPVFLDVLEETVGWLKPWNRKSTLTMLGLVKPPLPTVYDLREILDNLGWIDQCDNAVIKLRKEREPLDGMVE